MNALAEQIATKGLELPRYPSGRLFGRRALTAWLNEQGVLCSIHDVRTMTAAGERYWKPSETVDADVLADVEDGVHDPRAQVDESMADIDDDSMEVIAETKTVINEFGEKSWIRRKPKTAGARFSLRLPDVRPIHVELAEPRKRGSLPTAVFFGDEQIHYWSDARGIWRTTHDERAMDVAAQLVKAVQEDRGVTELTGTGDIIDFPTFSKHRSAKAMSSDIGLNMAIQRTTEWHSLLAALTPDARRTLVLGNHENRLVNWLSDNASAISGIRKGTVGEAAAQAPTLSLTNLLSIDQTGWALSQAYPEGRHYISERSRVIHGTCAKVRHVQNADTYLNEAQEDVFFGHTHRPGVSYRSVRTFHGIRQFVAANPGALCRMDGAVPSAMGSVTAAGTPTQSWGERWDQGILIVTYDPTDMAFCPIVEHVPIRNGVAYWNGQRFESDIPVDGTALYREELAERVALREVA